MSESQRANSAPAVTDAGGGARTRDHLRGLMRRYRTDRLVGTDPAQFKRRIDEFLRLDDHAMEGFGGPEHQRDLSVKFHWGHDHDFGDFALSGRMASRHVDLLATFADQFGAMPMDLAGRRVLDIGCWTGGTSLLLSAMGASVVAIEEVRKYVECVRYLKSAFAIDSLDVQHRSLYECTSDEFRDAFDLALFAGVLYHVTDPVLALRIVFNSLRDGGACLLETLAFDSDDAVLAYQGPQVVYGSADEQRQRGRGGWNWLVPSPGAVAQLMRDVGFVDVRIAVVRPGPTETRAFAVGRRQRHVDMMRGGLSVRTIR